MKTAAGLIVVAVIGVIAWSALSGSDDDRSASEVSVVETVDTTPESTAPPSTAAPLVRTGVNRAEPLVLPLALLTVDEVTVAPASPGSSALLMTAPDQSLLWMAEFDGAPAPVDGLDIRQIGAVGVGVPQNRSDGAAVSYRLLTPCGLVILNDAPGAPVDRPEIVSLFESMSVDGDATIDVSLPAGFSVFDIGDVQTSYTAQFQVPVFGETRAARLVQIPEGSLAQLTFGGRQLAPTTFLGGPAFVDAAPNDPSLVSIFWKDGRTVFNLSSPELTFADLESFVTTLEPATADDWAQRFDSPPPETPVEDSGCAPQPDFGPTLNP